jgi:chromate transporter
MEQTGGATTARGRGSAWEILRASARLGVSAFGGPIAHVGWFREEYVWRRGLLDEEEFSELVGLCQILPGPSSSQLGVAIGLLRAGPRGAAAAWLGFTLPSVVLMLAFAAAAGTAAAVPEGVLHGLRLAAVAVVAQAVRTMWRANCGDRRRAGFAVAAAAILLAWRSPVSQPAVLAAAALAGVALLPGVAGAAPGRVPLAISRRAGGLALAVFAALLAGLPLARAAGAGHAVATAAAFFDAGALVFGGGHVVLPLLQQAVVAPGWVSAHDFVAGYGAAQALPGPLFTFAAYLGSVQGPSPNGLAGGLLALAAIFAPGLLLVVGVSPFYAALRGRPRAAAALAGVGAAVVGVLAAALWRPVLTSAVTGPADVAIAAAALAALELRRVPPVVVVAACAVAGAAIA